MCHMSNREKFEASFLRSLLFPSALFLWLILIERATVHTLFISPSNLRGIGNSVEFEFLVKIFVRRIGALIVNTSMLL